MARAQPDLLPPEAEAALASWRGRALIVMLIVVAVSGLPAYLAPIWNALRAGRFPPLLWVYCGVYAAFVVLAFLPRLAARPRAWAFFALAYANAAASLARLGEPKQAEPSRPEPSPNGKGCACTCGCRSARPGGRT